jgi:hypothetical protein
MDQLTTALGLAHLVNTPRPTSLADWNAQYEAQSIRNDWWFKACAAAIGWISTSFVAVTGATAPAPQLARA